MQSQKFVENISSNDSSYSGHFTVHLQVLFSCFVILWRHVYDKMSMQ